ncbi:MAG: DUF3604 domain-containing protein, partial [Gammaproteobacteria bacterium AqS3]|nr:DUF3604 domain-containing protein [Gammaproteobacteria bacterium AqS3]
MIKWLGAGIGLLLLLIGAGLYGIGVGWFVELDGIGQIEGPMLPEEITADIQNAQRAAAEAIEAGTDRQILFGDLHVHTTISLDAFLLSLPVLGAEGAHPVADACDFARYCAALDFWSINDHAEVGTAKQWSEAKQAIRQCNAVAGPEENPDMVSFLGWEWTQVGQSPKEHYGHKNVIFRDTAEDAVPRRAIGALGIASSTFAGTPLLSRIGAYITAPGGDRRRWLEWAAFSEGVANLKPCTEGVPVRDLPDDCRENVATPAELFGKLNDWGFDSIVIPHGNTWGFYSPPGIQWDTQLDESQNDPELQTLIEMHSGHGNSEEYRPWRAAVYSDAGEPVCPAPTRDYLPDCWRAGQIIQERCLADDEDAATCEERAADARAKHLRAGVAGRLVVPGAEGVDWGDSGQCRDCFLPAFSYRPGGSAQYALAITDFDNAEANNFHFGFISSSDNHFARPGTGYKEYGRRGNTEANGPRSADIPQILQPPPAPPQSSAVEIDPLEIPGFARLDTERQASFFTTGGLAVVHAENRSRGAVWDALKRRETYATSGDRILLWFNLIQGPRRAPMGSKVELRTTPTFEVKAVGAFEQKPGCPEHVHDGLSPERIAELCMNECYHPSDVRRRIT